MTADLLPAYLAYEATWRTCPCGFRGPPCAFPVDRSRPHGRGYRCKPCESARSSAYQKRRAVKTLSLFREGV